MIVILKLKLPLWNEVLSEDVLHRIVWFHDESFRTTKVCCFSEIDMTEAKRPSEIFDVVFCRVDVIFYVQPGLDSVLFDVEIF